ERNLKSVYCSNNGITILSNTNFRFIPCKNGCQFLSFFVWLNHWPAPGIDFLAGMICSSQQNQVSFRECTSKINIKGYCFTRTCRRAGQDTTFLNFIFCISESCFYSLPCEGAFFQIGIG